ncbi:alpha/beta hydrolase [Qipengyuania sp. RANM35]|uniref:alpha/beta hydrolase n=1 Tax=Qipengyuania sp. RANM35 TaxID=3068635 RepID=UPI0034DB4D3B
MVSLPARLVNFGLPLLGIRRFFSQPEKLDERIAELRRKPSPRPGKGVLAKFDVSEDNSRGYPVITMVPKGAAESDAPHLLYLHGGGYVMDVAALHWSALARLCSILGASATVPVYPLAPEHKAPHILGEMRKLYGELVESHGAQRITIMGDSAGGGMSLALAQIIRDDDGPLPGSLVLFSPWLDATASEPEQKEIEKRDRMIAVSGLEACGQLYRGELELTDPRVSPLFGAVQGLPPMAIFSGTSDILVVDGRRLDARLRETGLSTHEYHEYHGMFHVWMLLPIPEGRRAIEQTADFICRHLRTQ